MSYANRSRLNYFLKAALLMVPLLATQYHAWSWILEMVLLLIVFLHGKESGARLTGILTVLGYSAAAVVAVNNASFDQIGFVPLAGVLFLWIQNKISVKDALFWSITLTVLISALPTIGIVKEALTPAKVDEVVAMTMQSYEQNGNIHILEEKGISKEVLEGYVKKVISLYYQILPAAAGVIGMLEFVFIYTLYRRLLMANSWEGKVKTPFTRWRMPWYAIWGVNAGLGLYLIGDSFSTWAVWKIVGMNILSIYAVLGFIFGFSCLAYLLQRPKTPRFLIFIVIIGGAIYLPFTLTVLIFIGIFDIVFNLRRIPEGKEGEAK
ncbi:Protein of unknown function DUF2232, membrane [Syntrophobotulus glycolicus DSM 8271]|uniref:DUF2232 domain-containing protein n=1 Tax=Syntrophobotulus glycolicus (strain DSM 8271 / FlGlyR) TaxID=645991 RepID=F0T2X3_SYNGF|nr:DUF2232 domain-containing protein [Syntrophobotulus glycolicus]ADY57610.1 Protein of unknown function DUF2232, membrane [Syntrophobotulus glycolicus DSM 8271]